MITGTCERGTFLTQVKRYIGIETVEFFNKPQSCQIMWILNTSTCIHNILVVFVICSFHYMHVYHDLAAYI